ncbi:hypothetical protein L1987_65077 [Smallanthus sonchifolius]|uniref:Uncharacterized protein n=1 Tax=Smallanthus sonchifolius TaxID=185202 RepID=A0ACB9BTG1_9ASTR|nr:hypothetical protein L1987_65077 [Smallanthus sonchifolius]
MLVCLILSQSSDTTCRIVRLQGDSILVDIGGNNNNYTNVIEQTERILRLLRHHCLHAWRRATRSFIGCTTEVPSAWSVAVAFAESCQRRLAWIVSCNVWSSVNKAISSKVENTAADKPISSNLC